VILPYPRIDTTTMTLAAPDGFEPAAPPQPITINSPVGGYSLHVVTTPEGFSVVRSLTLAFLRIDPGDYHLVLDFLNQVRTADRTWLQFERTPRS
jgi:hypothetical protein